ncbi:MAG: MFS transporter [Patescibacteria group bacterium]
MREKLFWGFSPNVIVLSLVSFLNDIGGETIKRALPLYLANVLGVKAGVIGLVEGVAEATPQLLQPLSGYLSDMMQKRKPLVVVGQILRSSMIFLYWAASWPQILLLRFLDRSGKGIANAPRDALISASISRDHVGRAFGLSRALDNAGAVVGMIVAAFIVFMGERQALFLQRAVFNQIVLLAVIPLLLALSLIILLVRDVPFAAPSRTPLRWGNTLGPKFYLGTKFRLFLLFSFLFALGNSSDAFLVLKAQLVGLPLWQIFLLLSAYSLVSSLSGLPFASLSDKLGRKKLLVWGWFLYAGVYFLFGKSSDPGIVAMVFLLYGLYYGLTEGAAKALVADTVAAERRGTAYGFYNLVVGATLLPASLIAGFLWQTFTPAGAFYFGSFMAFISAIGLLMFL